MTTSREEIRKIIVNMKQQFEARASSNLAENRRQFDMAGLLPTLPEGIQVESAQLSPEISADWIIPKACQPEKVILYLHGGGFSVGSSISHRPLCSRIAHASNCKVLCINYRLAPENKYPAALDDAVFSYLWLVNHNPASKVIIIGDSAGGGLAFATLLKIRDEKFPMAYGAATLSAWLDLECTSASYQQNSDMDLMATEIGLRFVGRGYANKNINKTPYISPFYATDFSGLCPILMQVGDAETLLDENKSVADKATLQHVKVDLQIWPNMVHVWHSLYGLIPEADQAINALGRWVNAC